MHQGDEDDIRRKAYEIWESEGRPEGRHDEHWRRAEEEVDAEDQKAQVGGTGPIHQPGPPTTGADAQPSADTAGEAGSPPSGRPGSSRKGSGAVRAQAKPKASAGEAARRDRLNP